MRKFDNVSMYYDDFMKFFNLYKFDEILDALELKGEETIMDIGGGTGRLADVLQERAKCIYVLDESIEMLTHAKMTDKIFPIPGNALDISFGMRKVDVAIISDVLHHIEDQRRLILEAKLVLEEKGRLLILDFEKRHIKTWLLRIFERILFGKLYFRSQKEVVRLMEEHFNITKIINKGYYFILMGEKRSE